MTEVLAPIVASVWKIDVAVGAVVEKGQTLAVLESMKMEIPVEAPFDAAVSEIRVEPGQIVQEGDVVLVLDPTVAWRSVGTDPAPGDV